MFEKESPVGKKSLETSFPADANVKVLIEGLAFCYLNPSDSKIHFLSHVDFHKLHLTIIQKRRDSGETSLLLETGIEAGHSISIKAENAVTPDDVVTDGHFPLKELINITGLHGRKINEKDFPPKYTPITLSINDCAFYTEKMTPFEFDIIEIGTDSGDVIVDTKKIGYAMGGKIKCGDTSGSITVEIKGSHPSKLKCPLSDNGRDFVFEINLSNHCIETERCRELIEDGSDFSFYYDLLEDSVNPKRKFKIKKSVKPGFVASAIDVAACNVIIVQPPPG